MRATTVFFCLCAAAAGCALLSPDRIRTERQAAYIRYYEYPTLLEAPDTVPAGVSFTVTVRTFGGGCTDQGDTETDIVGRSVEVRPFDVFTTHLPSGVACPAILRLYAHTASVRLDQPGSTTLRAIGRIAPGDSTTAIERTVVVK